MAGECGTALKLFFALKSLLAIEKKVNKKFLYSFRLPVKPIAWARPAPCKWGMYDTQSKIKQEYLLRFKTIYKAVYLTQEPLFVWCQYSYSVPRSWSKHKQRKGIAGEIPHLAQDVDNCLKFTFDLFNGTIWADDRQIVGVCAMQKWDCQDSIEIKVWQWLPTEVQEPEFNLD